MGEEYHENLTPKVCIHVRRVVCEVTTKLLQSMRNRSVYMDSLSIDINRNAEPVKSCLCNGLQDDVEVGSDGTIYQGQC